jgi:hypothetical protein
VYCRRGPPPVCWRRPGATGSHGRRRREREKHDSTQEEATAATALRSPPPSLLFWKGLQRPVAPVACGPPCVLTKKTPENRHERPAQQQGQEAPATNGRGATAATEREGLLSKKEESLFGRPRRTRCWCCCGWPSLCAGEAGQHTDALRGGRNSYLRTTSMGFCSWPAKPVFSTSSHSSSKTLGSLRQRKVSGHCAPPKLAGTPVF